MMPFDIVCDRMTDYYRFQVQTRLQSGLAPGAKSPDLAPTWKFDVPQPRALRPAGGVSSCPTLEATAGCATATVLAQRGCSHCVRRGMGGRRQVFGRMPYAAVLAVLAVAAAAAPATPVADPRRGLLRLSHAELQSLAPTTRASLRDAVCGEGAVLLTHIPGYGKLTAEALGALGDCLREHAAVPDGPVRSALPGGVERQTIAASAYAGAARPLPPWVAERCPGTEAPAEQLRSFTRQLLGLLARAADSTASDAPPEPEGEGSSLRQPGRASRGQHAALEHIVRQGHHLEHFHRYAQGHGERRAALERHTDAGIMQALAVRWRAAPPDAGPFGVHAGVAFR